LLWTRSPKSLIGLAGVAAGAAMIPLLSATTAPPAKAPSSSVGAPAAPAALARISSGGQAESQSAGFRIQLWKSAIDMIESSPLIGHGPGSFRWLSAAEGRTPQTQFAHQAWLETAAESGLPALILLLTAGLLWLRILFKGAKSLSPEQNALRAASLAAVMALAAHGFVDSVFSFFGLAVLFFASIGLGLLTSLDGVTPEMTPRGYRMSAAAIGAAALLILAVPPALSEARLSSALEAAASRDANATQAALDGLQSTGEEGLLKARLMQALDRPAEERIDVLKSACASLPSPRSYRALADTLEEAGRIDDALFALDRALKYDPHNLPARSRRLDLLRNAGRQEEAVQEAQALIAIEAEPYFQVRALAELIPTETYRARFWLARQMEGVESAEMAAAGVRGLLEYAKLTLPMVKRFGEVGEAYAGETLPKASEKLEEAIQAAEAASNAYRMASRDTEAEDLRKAASELGSALTGLDENSNQRLTS
jgi:tetratricopeptide (TPR) repeat protein